MIASSLAVSLQPDDTRFMAVIEWHSMLLWRNFIVFCQESQMDSSLEIIHKTQIKSCGLFVGMMCSWDQCEDSWMEIYMLYTYTMLIYI